MTSLDKITESDLNSYVDGELDAKAMHDVEVWLTSHPEDVARVEAYRRQKDELHNLFDAVEDETIPTSILQSFESPSTRKFSFNWQQLATAVVMLMVGSVAGWQGHSLFQGPQISGSLQYVDRAVGAHLVYASEVRHPVEVSVDQEAHLVKWLSKRVGAPLKPPSLITSGYELMGGRLLEDSKLPAAQFMYEDQTGRRITVYMRANDGKDSAFKFIEEEGASAFYWIDAPFAYALVGDISRTELLTIAELVYEDLGL